MLLASASQERLIKVNPAIADVVGFNNVYIRHYNGGESEIMDSDVMKEMKGHFLVQMLSLTLLLATSRALAIFNNIPHFHLWGGQY